MSDFVVSWEMYRALDLASEDPDLFLTQPLLAHDVSRVG